MKQQRVHILTAVNAANVSKSGSLYTIKDVCGAVDGIVMNRRLYPAEALVAGVKSLEGKPAPAGHPRDDKGRAISAANGDALLTSYIGAVCKNARHQGGRTLVDVVVNEGQAKAHADGAKLVERLEAAISGADTSPIHVSTGLYHSSIRTNGEAGGRQYDEIVTGIQYDHLAILLNTNGAGTPDDGVGMWLNDAGEEHPVEVVTLNTEPEDKRSAGIKAWLLRLVGNGTELSFDQISEGLYRALPEGCWVREVFDRYAIWADRDGKFWKQDYSVSSEGSVAFSGAAVEVHRRTTYVPVTNLERDPMKDKILAALNAAGVKTEGLDEAALLTAYNALVGNAAKTPVEQQLTAANAELDKLRTNAQAAEQAEITALATELATNGGLTVDDLKRLPLTRLKELKAKAAPVLTGNAAGGGGDEFAGYSLNVKEGK
jgi:hypothetical protein